MTVPTWPDRGGSGIFLPSFSGQFYAWQQNHLQETAGGGEGREGRRGEGRRGGSEGEGGGGGGEERRG